jgi:hypothetical protein
MPLLRGFRLSIPQARSSYSDRDDREAFFLDESKSKKKE